MKVAVGLIFLADLFHTGFLFAYLYNALIARYGISEALNDADWGECCILFQYPVTDSIPSFRHRYEQVAN